MNMPRAVYRALPLAAVAAGVCLALVALVAVAAQDDSGGAPRSAAGVVAEARPYFAELEGSGLDFVHFNGMSGEFYMPEINGGGGALFDYDNDGDLDAYLVQGNMLGPGKEVADARVAPRHPIPLTDRLYRNELLVRPDGGHTLRFTDVTEEAGIGVTAYGFGVATGDYDNSGWVDLYVTNLGSNNLLKNKGDGTFADVTSAAGADDNRWSVPAAFVDYDRDGWLDLFIGNYLHFTFDNHKVCRTVTGAQDYCGPSAYPSVPDRLLRNRGDGTFEDVTVRVGIHRVANKSLGVVAADFNGSGRTDFYVASDQTPNQLWVQQEGGDFVDEALLAGSAVNAAGQAEASMGVDAGDPYGDGREHLFMTHLGLETNTLFRNEGEGMFEDVSSGSGLGMPSWPYTGWGTLWFDFDNDGWLELMVANGAVRVVEALARTGDPFPFHERNQLFRNLGHGRLEEVTSQAGPAFVRSEVSRAIAIGDLNNNGAPDVLLVNNNGPARILVNQVGSHKPWLGLRLIGSAVDRDMLGTRVVLLRDGEPPLWRRVRTDGGFAAAHDPRIRFGLGDNPRVDRVRAYWPGGRVEEWTDLPLRRYTTLREGSGTPVAP